MKTVIQDLKGNRLYYEEITLYNKQHTFYIDHRRWLRGLPCNFPCTVIENMNEVFPKYFALESRLSDTIYKIADDSTSIISHDSEYFKIIEQVIKRTYPGTITLAYEDLTKEAL